MDSEVGGRQLACNEGIKVALVLDEIICTFPYADQENIGGCAEKRQGFSPLLVVVN